MRNQGAQGSFRHEVGRGTIARMSKAAGTEPASQRRQGMTWKKFLRTHWEVLAATDFFTVQLWTAKGLIRYHVMFVIRRRDEIPASHSLLVRRLGSFPERLLRLVRPPNPPRPAHLGQSKAHPADHHHFCRQSANLWQFARPASPHPLLSTPHRKVFKFLAIDGVDVILAAILAPFV